MGDMPLIMNGVLGKAEDSEGYHTVLVGLDGHGDRGVNQAVIVAQSIAALKDRASSLISSKELLSSRYNLDNF